LQNNVLGIAFRIRVELRAKRSWKKGLKTKATVTFAEDIEK
jgi:hypothetical protein